MTPVRAALVLTVAVLVSAQVLMLGERGRSMRQRLRNLSWGGEASSLLLATALIGGALGLLLGSFRDRSVLGLVAGLVVGLLSWTSAIVWAHRGSQEPRHRQPEA